MRKLFPLIMIFIFTVVLGLAYAEESGTPVVGVPGPTGHNCKQENGQIVCKKKKHKIKYPKGIKCINGISRCTEWKIIW